MRAPRQRRLADSECSARCGSLPLVLAPAAGGSAGGIVPMLQEHGNRVCALVEEHGAVLLRGWDVSSARALAEAAGALGCGLTSVDDYFPAEHGRDEVVLHGRVAVWPTNSLAATGGYLRPEILPHTENYYAVGPPPRVVCFCCSKAPWVGGETALFDGRAAFASLPAALRRKLEAPCSVRRILSLARLEARHGVGPSELQTLNERVAAGGASIHPLGATHVSVGFVRAAVGSDEAPPLARESGLRERSGPPAPSPLQFNFGECGEAARQALLLGMLRRGLFSGGRWAVHRLLWSLALRYSIVATLLSLIDGLPCWLRRPIAMTRMLLEKRRAAAAAAAEAEAQGGRDHGVDKTGRRRRRAASSARRARGDETLGRLPTLGERLTEAEGERIGRALAAHAAVFSWEVGDLLLIDNARVMHDGMPGVGPRELHVALLAKQG